MRALAAPAPWWLAMAPETAFCDSQPGPYGATAQRSGQYRRVGQP